MTHCIANHWFSGFYLHHTEMIHLLTPVKELIFCAELQSYKIIMQIIDAKSKTQDVFKWDFFNLEGIHEWGWVQRVMKHLLFVH